MFVGTLRDLRKVLPGAFDPVWIVKLNLRRAADAAPVHARSRQAEKSGMGNILMCESSKDYFMFCCNMTIGK